MIEYTGINWYYICKFYNCPKINVKNRNKKIT